MLKLSESTLEKITKDDTEIDYLKSRAFDIKRHLKKTQKRTGMNRGEISAVIAEKMGQWKSSEKYLDHLTSVARFKSKGDIHVVQYENIVKYLSKLSKSEVISNLMTHMILNQK